MAIIFLLLQILELIVSFFSNVFNLGKWFSRRSLHQMLACENKEHDSQREENELFFQEPRD